MHHLDVQPPRPVARQVMPQHILRADQDNLGQLLPRCQDSAIYFRRGRRVRSHRINGNSLHGCGGFWSQASECLHVRGTYPAGLAAL